MTISFPDHEPKEYTVSVRTNDIHEAIAALAGALYTLTEEALSIHDRHEAEECEFEEFARDILGVLTRHADQLSAGSSPWLKSDEDGPGYD